MWTVYIHENKTNLKKYIGITSCDVKRRWKNGYGYAEGLPIRRAIDKYGWDGFNHFIMFENLKEDDAKMIEIELIKKFATQDDRFGYNITSGGEGMSGWRPTEETKRKIAEKAKLRTGSSNPNYGNYWTEEMKVKSSVAHRRENLSEETLKKMSESAKNRKGDRNPFWRKKHTSETKRKIAQYRVRSVVMFDLNDNKIKEFESIKSASENMGINKVAISNCCRGLSKTSGGYVWKYKDSLQ